MNLSKRPVLNFFDEADGRAAVLNSLAAVRTYRCSASGMRNSCSRSTANHKFGSRSQLPLFPRASVGYMLVVLAYHSAITARLKVARIDRLLGRPAATSAFGSNTVRPASKVPGCGGWKGQLVRLTISSSAKLSQKFKNSGQLEESKPTSLYIHPIYTIHLYLIPFIKMLIKSTPVI